MKKNKKFHQEMNSYMKKITKELIAMSDSPDNQFRECAAYYDSDGIKCELCGHNPIKNIFEITCIETDETRKVGSECVKNYMDVDLANGINGHFGKFKKIWAQKILSEKCAWSGCTKSREKPYNFCSHHIKEFKRLMGYRPLG